MHRLKFSDDSKEFVPRGGAQIDILQNYVNTICIIYMYHNCSKPEPPAYNRFEG